MTRALLSLAAPVMLLAACKEQPPATMTGDAVAEAQRRADVTPVMGEERRIAVLADGVLDAATLAAEDRFAPRLEAVLRARGLNARVVQLSGAADFTSVLQDPALRPELVIMPAHMRDDPAWDALIARHRVAVIHADLADDRDERPELFQPGGNALSVLGVEELAVSIRGAVMTALGPQDRALVPAKPD